MVVINGLFVAAEFAIAASSRPRVAQLAQSGSSSAQRVMAVLADPDHINRYLSTAQIGITLASLGLGMYGEHSVARWLLPPLETLGILGVTAAHTAATIIAVALLTYLHVVLGEMVPKSLALQSPARAAVRLSPFMAATEVVFRPFTAVLNWIGNWLLDLTNLPRAGAATRLMSAADLSYIVEDSSKGGLLDPSEQVFLENVIDFHERTVSQVMTPRTRMAALSSRMDPIEALATVFEQPHSRFPVYEADRDHIIGVLHVKDLARRLVQPEQEFPLTDLIRPVVLVPESLALDDMLDRFRREHIQIAVVLDEYGGTAGIVTMEDLAEEIIGEIQDEFDQEIAPFEEIAPHVLRVRGDLLLDELDQHFDLTFDAEDAETVGGLIMSALGRVPQPGETVDYAGLRLEVEEVDGLAIKAVRVELPWHEGQAPNALPGDSRT